jgi:hypothetical protein
MTGSPRVRQRVLNLTAALLFACCLPFFLLAREDSAKYDPAEMHALARELRVGSTQAETLAFLRAKGFSDADIRIYSPAPGANASDISWPLYIDNPAGGDQIHAETGRYFARGPNPAYFRMICNFDRQGLLVAATAQGSHWSLTWYDEHPTLWKGLVSATPPPPR